MSADVTSGSPLHVSRSSRIAIGGLAGYDLLLVALLVSMTAARLWLVPGYLRADTWLALAAGRDIWHSGIPHTETLTALANGGRWIDQQWLGHLSIYGLWRVGGLALVAALSALLAAGSFGAMVIAARRFGARARTVLLLMPVTVFPFYAQAWQPRTQMFAYPLFTATFLLLLADARRHSPRVLLTLGLLVLWANVHGSAVLGAALIALRGLLLVWERRSSPRDIPVLTAAALIALPWVALLLTPYGVTTASYYRDTLLDPAFKQLATEWQPITADPLLFAPFVVLVPLTVWTLVRARRDTTLFERIALVLLVLAAANALRNMVWLSLGAVPILSIALDRVVPRAREGAVGGHINRVLAVAACVAATIALSVTLARPTRTFQRSYPQGYLGAVHTASARDPSARIVADVGDADWLLWKDTTLRGKVAFDARFELLSASGVHDIASLLRGSGGSSLRGSAYRIFALDRRAAAATVRQLEAVPGARVAYVDHRRVVIVLSARL